jgi:nitrate ABC transporter ATP-binding subunit
MTLQAPLKIVNLTKVFDTPSGPYTAVRGVDIQVFPGEFACILGHSGCGKSTVLSIVAGLEKATSGGIVVEGKEVDEPGVERAVVFQKPSLFPWLTARENVRMAVDHALRSASRDERSERVAACLDLVGIADMADQLPTELSLGTQQCVSLARAIAVKPRFLLLDEPFSMLDSLTRFELQDTLLGVWERLKTIVVMVTHDVDEALYLADKLILMTDGPAASVGDVLTVGFPRPRRRTEVLEHPEYYSCHSRIIDFLDNHSKQFAHVD